MMKDEKKNKNKAFIKEVIVILVTGLLINLFCFYICSITGHCANNVQEDFPLEIGVPQNIPIPSSVVNQAINGYISILSSQYGYDGSAGALCFLENNDGNRYWLTCCDSLVINLSNYPTSFTYQADHQHWVQFVYDSSTGTLSNGNFYGGYVGTWTLSPTSLSIGHGWVLGSVRDNLYATDGTLVWTKTVEPITGHARPTDPPEKEDIDDPPTPPTWQDLPHTVPPTLSDSIQDWLSYIGSEINRLGRELSINLENWIEYIGDSINYAIQKLIDNIYNFMTNLVDNIKSFFQPILESIQEIIDGIKDTIDAIVEKINWFLEPFSSQELATNLNNGSFSSDILGLTSSVTTFGQSLTSGTEPNSCTFTLDFSNSYYDFGVCEFSLDWIIPMRPGIRLILGCLCIYSLIVSIFTSINTYIGGTSSINDDI